MPLLKRAIEKIIDTYLKSDDMKILFVWGPWRSGKTTLIDKLTKELGVTKYNFDLVSDREKFAPRREVLEKIVKDKPGMNPGAYMGLIMAKFKGKIDGKKAMEILKKLL